MWVVSSTIPYHRWSTMRIPWHLPHLSRLHGIDLALAELDQHFQASVAQQFVPPYPQLY
jgi:hypothetical protein